MSKTEIIRKLQLYKKNPDLVKEISNTELADLVLVVMQAVKTIDQSIQDGRLDGKTPQPDKDYISKETAQKLLREEVDKMLKKTDSVLAETSSELEKRVQKALDNIRDGQDGIVSDEEIERAALMAEAMIELPDFDALVTETVQSNGALVRDSLESLPEGEEQLAIEAIRGLRDELNKLKENVGKEMGQFIGGGVSEKRILQLIEANAGSGGSTISVDGSEVSDPDFVSTGDVDFVASGSDVTANLNNDTVGLDELSATGTPSNSTFLRGDNTWATPAGGGDVTGPASSTNNSLAVYDGTTGKIIKDGGATIAQVRDRSTHTGTQLLSTISDVTATASEVNILDGVTATTAEINKLDGVVGNVVGTSDTQTLTNKTIDGDSNTLTNLDIGNEVDWASATDVADRSATPATGDKLLLFEDGVGLRKIDWSDLPGGGSSISFGADNQIPVTNSTTDDFDYSANLTFDGNSLVSSRIYHGSSTYGSSQGLFSGPVFAIGTPSGYVIGGATGMGVATGVGPLGGTLGSSNAFAGFLIASKGVTESSSSGTHPLVTAMAVKPLDITNGTHNTTSASTVYIEGASTGTASPTNNYALWVDAGATRLDGTLELGHATDTTLARASAGDVSIEGNIIYRAGGTDVPVTDGGTGSSTASGARTNLGLAIGSDVQAHDAGLDDIASLAVTDGNIIVGNGTNWVAESGATARTSLGLTIGTDVQAYSANLDTYASNPLTAGEIGQLQNINSVTISNTQWGYLGALDQGLTTASSPQFSTVELGNASDTTLSRDSAGVLAVEGVVVPTISSTNTLTNKKIDPRQDSQASTASITPDKSTYDEHYRTAQAAGITINNIASPSVGDKVVIYLTDNGTSRSISFGTDYVGLTDQALPTATTVSKTMEIGIVYVTATKAIVSYVEQA